MGDALDYIRTHYNVPAEVGRIITFQGQRAIITGAHMSYLCVAMEGDPRQARVLIHPTWKVDYSPPDMGPYKPATEAVRHSRAKDRYRRYLEVADCYHNLTFKEFLTFPQFADHRRV